MLDIGSRVGLKSPAEAGLSNQLSFATKVPFGSFLNPYIKRAASLACFSFCAPISIAKLPGGEIINLIIKSSLFTSAK